MPSRWSTTPKLRTYFFKIQEEKVSKMNITSRKTNIEIKSKLPCEKPLLEQLEVMEERGKRNCMSKCPVSKNV